MQTLWDENNKEYRIIAGVSDVGSLLFALDLAIASTKNPERIKEFEELHKALRVYG